VKVASPEPDISLGKLFKVTTAYWILLLVNIGILLVFPGLATFLPNLLK
jgi:hypothetical protein